MIEPLLLIKDAMRLCPASPVEQAYHAAMAQCPPVEQAYHADMLLLYSKDAIAVVTAILAGRYETSILEACKHSGQAPSSRTFFTG